NPGLDADVVKDASALDFGRTSGGEVETSFPVIFARNDAERQAIEQDLKAKLASINPAEPPEYGSAPAPSPAAAPPAPAVAAVEPTPAVVPPPSAAVPAPSTETALAPVPGPAVSKPKPHRHYAAPKPPPPSLLDQVQAALKADRRLSRVRAY